MNKEEIIKALKEAKEKAKKRNFVQTFDLSIALRDIDLKKPENRIKTIIFFDKLNKKNKIVAFVEAKYRKYAENADLVITEQDIKEYNDKRKARKIAKEYDFFIAMPTMMARIARVFGKYLGPRGKMPDPKFGMIVPKPENLPKVIEKFRTAVRINMKDNPNINVKVGDETMDLEDVAENIMKVYETLIEKLPKRRHNIKGIYVKLTMGPSVAIYERK